jgi:predicted Zn-dependent protease
MHRFQEGLMRRFPALPALALLLVFVFACAKVPLTGRSQLNLVSSSEMLSMSEQQYHEFLQEHPPSKDAAGTTQVRRVGGRIQKAVERYMNDNGYGNRMQGYQWQFNLVDDQQVNAWCMPGGRVVVYSGLLPVARDDAGLAVVMGHEIAHAVAEHGAERMSQGMMAQLGGIALSEALKTHPAETQNLWLQAYAVGAQYGAMLPFSRVQESEADHLGIIFMAMAGYDPKTAAEFWKRMAAAKQGSGAPPEWLSTHPADETRIKNLEALIPEAMKYYTPSTSAAD